VKSKFVEIGGLKTHYLSAGEGPMLVMLHGQAPGSCAKTEWPRNIDFFADAGYAVYAPDQAGFGLTDNPDDYSVAVRIAHMRAFVDHFAPERYTIWGCSMGANMGAEIALADPRVDRLVLMPSSQLPPRGDYGSSDAARYLAGKIHSYAPSMDSARELLSLILYDQSLLTEALVRDFYEASAGKNQEAERRRREVGRPPTDHEVLRNLRVPTLLLWALDDPSAIPERALLMQRLIPRAELHVLSHARHWVQYDRPDRANLLVLEFLRARL
jgi:pimeloyl-ACP methyl ester carboxylesterase